MAGGGEALANGLTILMEPPSSSYCPDASVKPYTPYHRCSFNTPTEYSLNTATSAEAFKLGKKNKFPSPLITYVCS